jgi:hypothetical protein
MLLCSRRKNVLDSDGGQSVIIFLQSTKDLILELLDFAIFFRGQHREFFL